MKAKGFGGAQDGNDKVPHGPTFFSPEWRELYKHTLREANRLGLEMSLKADGISAGLESRRTTRPGILFGPRRA